MSDTSQLEPPPAASPTEVRPEFEAAFFGAPTPMLLIAVDPPRFTMTAVNRAHATAFRTTPEALSGRGLFEVFPAAPEPRMAAFVETIRSSLDRVIATRRGEVMPVQAYATRGLDERFWSATLTPIFGPDGAVSHVLSISRDVTAEVNERQASEARALLMREVDHRARNALTVVQAIVRLTTARSLDAFKQVVQGRVEALARAQTSLARRKWEGAALDEVLEAELAAIALPRAWRLSGPPILLPPEKVQAMSMILHELATNAAKYGAFSMPEGTVSVTWSVEAGDLNLVWRETGGPVVQAPARMGFGSRLIRQLTRQLGGGIRKHWLPEGVVVDLTAPL
ncbi:MAG: PAS domain-containing protein [Alphaproteobacteria bacterium]|nr:PAS domain-containing protein [Alphaproteobacteria bacterium]